MAEGTECFNIGDEICCETVHREKIKGEVLAFDSENKTLLLRSQTPSGRSSTYDVYLLNVAMLRSIVPKPDSSRSSSSTPMQLPSLNVNQLKEKAKENVQKKEAFLKALKAGCTVDGQKLFIALSKTMSEITWYNADILVMKSVVISPPYLPENIRPVRDCQESHIDRTIEYVKKVVEKYYNDKSRMGKPQPTALPKATTEQAAAV